MYLTQSTNWRHFPDRIGIKKRWFLKRGENQSTRKKPLNKDEDQQQTQHTYETESGDRIRATLVGGECSHHCAIPAPPYYEFSIKTSIKIHDIMIFNTSSQFITNRQGKKVLRTVFVFFHHNLLSNETQKIQTILDGYNYYLENDDYSRK